MAPGRSNRRGKPVNPGAVVLIALAVSFITAHYLFKREDASGAVVRFDQSAGKQDRDASLQVAMVQHSTVGARMLERAVQHPDSFKFDKAEVISGTGTVCYQYRSSNAQGRMVKRQAVFPEGARSPHTNEMHGFSRLWDKECAGKNGTDATTAIRSSRP